jgi:hypothetical protein
MSSLKKAYEIFQSAESKSEVDRILLEELPIWPLLRIQVFFKLREKFGVEKEEPSEQKFMRNLGRAAWAAVCGLVRSLRATDVLFVSYDSELKTFNGLKLNKHFFSIYKKFDDDTRLMYLEKPVSGDLLNHPHREDFRINSLFLYALEFMIRRCLPEPEVQGASTLDQIYQAVDVPDTHTRDIKSFVAFRYIFRFFLSIWRPRVVVLTNHYNISHMALMAECHRRKIKVIEIQHGVINSQHPGYNYYNPKLVNRILKPDTLITFGEKVAEHMSDNFKEGLELAPCGHAYLSDVKSSLQSAAKLADGAVHVSAADHTTSVVSKNSRSVLVTLQTSNLPEVLAFVLEVAKLNPEIQFVLLPRRKNDLFAEANWPPNMSLVFDDFYKLIQNYQLHMTAFSTCAIEAPVFGVPNVLIDHDGMASFYYSEVLTSETMTVYISRPEQFANHKNMFDLKSSNVSDQFSSLIASDYQVRLNKYWPQISNIISSSL